MYYDMVISEVTEYVKDEVTTFSLRPMLRLNLMRHDLVPQSRNGKEANKR